MFHHDLQKLDNNFRRWSNKYLAFASFFSIVDTLKCISEYAHSNHDQGLLPERKIINKIKYVGSRSKILSVFE